MEHERQDERWSTRDGVRDGAQETGGKRASMREWVRKSEHGVGARDDGAQENRQVQ